MQTNQLTVTLIVAILGAVSLVSLALSGYLVHQGINDLGTIVVISSPGTTSLGGLIGLLGGTAVRQPRQE